MYMMFRARLVIVSMFGGKNNKNKYNRLRYSRLLVIAVNVFFLFKLIFFFFKSWKGTSPTAGPLQQTDATPKLLFRSLLRHLNMKVIWLNNKRKMEDAILTATHLLICISKGKPWMLLTTSSTITIQNTNLKNDKFGCHQRACKTPHMLKMVFKTFSWWSCTKAKTVRE